LNSWSAPRPHIYTPLADDDTHVRIFKKLSYRKEIARKLRIQYVEGIYNNSVTLKSKLRVTQGH